MRSILFIFALVLTFKPLEAQQKERNAEPKFYAEASRTEVMQGKPLNVTFRAEDIQGGKFIGPDWQEAGFIVLGSNQSSSVSIINGVVNAATTYSFTVAPQDTGALVIPKATIRKGDIDYTSEPLTIHVSPNPDGAVETPRPPNPGYHRTDPVAPDPPKKKIKTTRI